MMIFSDRPPEIEPLRIFVVEDHADTAKYLCLYLELLGHHVQCADTVQEALQELPAARCNLLLCDISLPDGNGWDLLPLVEDLLSTPICAVAMSVWVGKDAHAISEAAGYHLHLDRPLAPSAIHAVLDYAASLLADHPHYRATLSNQARPALNQELTMRRSFL